MLSQQNGEEVGAGSAPHIAVRSFTPPRHRQHRFWHDCQNLPRFMYHLKSVETTGQGRSHWVAHAPAGTTVEWDAVITADHPNSPIAWRSLEGADVEHTGSVRFELAPGGRGTVVTAA